MKFYSTNNKDNVVSLKEAVLNAFPDDRGLYMPTSIPTLSSSFIKNLDTYSFRDIAFTVSKELVRGDIPEDELYSIISRAINFPAPVINHDDSFSTLELFHGPSMAFKDFGARFMAEIMSYFLKNESQVTTILVATSGDTGGAVAAGFHNVPGINVIILYPSGKISPLQEKQLTTWGANISAVEINGVFDDCQALVKQAFLDKNLRQKFTFSSANSINIARLIPQSFYYFEAFKQVMDKDRKVVFSVPSGNFGNLTAGIMAYKMGLPIESFLAATNINDTVATYLNSGIYISKPSVSTISNAMDVGAPSNFVRLQHLFNNDSSTWNNMKKKIKGYAFNDMENRKAITELYKKYNYIADPHGAIGYLASKAYKNKYNDNSHIIYLETAHPCKFNDTVQETLNIKIKLPEQLSSFMSKEKQVRTCNKDFNAFKELLLSQ